MSCYRLLFRAYQQNTDAVNRWMHDEFTKIAAQAKAEGASIFFADEAGIRSDYYAGTTWAPRGQTPKIPLTGARLALKMISAITRKGEMHFLVTDKQSAPISFATLSTGCSITGGIRCILLLTGIRFIEVPR